MQSDFECLKEVPVTQPSLRPAARLALVSLTCSEEPKTLYIAPGVVSPVPKRGGKKMTFDLLVVLFLLCIKFT